MPTVVKRCYPLALKMVWLEGKGQYCNSGRAVFSGVDFIGSTLY
jgi:hypothetical protein